MNITKKLILTLISICYMLPAIALDLNQHPDVRAYINHLTQKYNYNENDLYRWFSVVNFNQSIIDSMTKPAESKSWIDYRKIFMQPARIEAGVNYWQTHAKTLAAAEKKYGVPAEIIVGILGVETGYGANKGKSYVLEALTTIAFQYPPRSKYFTSELTEFLLLSREQGWNPLTIKGSYAGAMGLPQFMPSSYRTYAVDGNQNGRINLFDDHEDVIASIGNYLEKKGWHRGEPSIVSAKVVNNRNQIPEADMNGKVKFTLKQLADNGFVPAKKVPKNLQVGLLAFETENGMQYWMTFHNFEVIKRYNTNSKYALVVWELGETVRMKR